MKNHFASTASTITAALLLVLLLSGSAHGGSLVVLNDEDIASRHDSVQTRTCEGGFAVTGAGEFSVLDTDASFSVHVCVEDHTSSTSEGGGVAMAPGSVRVVTGKVFNSAKQFDMTFEYLYHAHCMYIDEEGGVFVGVEIQESTGDHSNVQSQTKDEGDDNDRKLKAEHRHSKKAKNSKSESESEVSPSTIPSDSPSSSVGPSNVPSVSLDPSTSPSTSPSTLPSLSISPSTESSEECPIRRQLIHANEEITSGNEPKGTLGIFYFQRKEDFTEDHTRHGLSLFDEFDTACSDFADVVSRTDMMYMSKVTQGGFLFQEPL